MEKNLVYRISSYKKGEYNIVRIYDYTSGPRPRVAVALSGDGLALNVRLNDIVTFLDVFVRSRKNSSFTQLIVVFC
jgi:hypothetical protein